MGVHMRDASIQECYRQLAAAIVIQAKEEWTERCRYKGSEAARERWRMVELEKFFGSDWCEMLSGIPKESMLCAMDRIRRRYRH